VSAQQAVVRDVQLPQVSEGPDKRRASPETAMKPSGVGECYIQQSLKLHEAADAVVRPEMMAQGMCQQLAVESRLSRALRPSDLTRRMGWMDNRVLAIPEQQITASVRMSW